MTCDGTAPSARWSPLRSDEEAKLRESARLLAEAMPDYQLDGLQWSNRAMLRVLATIDTARRSTGAPDVEVLTRTLWTMPNKVGAWLREDMDTHELAEAVAAEYARLAEEFLRESAVQEPDLSPVTHEAPHVWFGERGVVTGGHLPPGHPDHSDMYLTPEQIEKAHKP